MCIHSILCAVCTLELFIPKVLWSVKEKLNFQFVEVLGSLPSKEKKAIATPIFQQIKWELKRTWHFTKLNRQVIVLALRF